MMSLRGFESGLAAGADAIIVSGGVSVGPYDVVKTRSTIGRIDLWRVAVQPGKPFTFGTAAAPGRRRDRSLLVRPSRQPGLVSEVTFELFVRPAIRATGWPDAIASPGRSRRPWRARLQEPGPQRRSSVSRADRDETGAPIRDGRGRVPAVPPLSRAGRGVTFISALAAADALAVIPEADNSLPAGAEVALWWLDRA